MAKSNFTYEITIKGNGTADEIIESLKSIIDGIKENKNNVAVLDGAEWEDGTLISEINQK